MVLDETKKFTIEGEVYHPVKYFQSHGDYPKKAKFAKVKYVFHLEQEKIFEVYSPLVSISEKVHGVVAFNSNNQKDGLKHFWNDEVLFLVLKDDEKK